jgi:hypothetical protein
MAVSEHQIKLSERAGELPCQQDQTLSFQMLAGKRFERIACYLFWRAVRLRWFGLVCALLATLLAAQPAPAILDCALLCRVGKLENLKID